jgi:hypothetical protein
MTTITVGSPEYKALLHRYNELFRLAHKTEAQVAEFLDIARQLDKAELEHDARAKGNVQ